MAFVSYSQVVDGLHARFATVAGLPQLDGDGNIINILKYEPSVIQTTPTLYTLLDGFARSEGGQITTMRYRILHRLVLPWQDNEQAELALMPFVHSIPASVDLSPTLGGLITLGLARITEAQSGFVIISDTKWRCLDFFSDVPTKAPVRSGI